LDGDTALRPPHPLSSLLQVLDNLLSGRLLGLGVGAVGQPVGHTPDGVSDPMSHVGHVHEEPPGSAHKLRSPTTLAIPLRSGGCLRDVF
jgi:hypothetical protein